MILRTITTLVVTLTIMGCQSGGGSGGSDELDCRSPERACPSESECIEGANGVFGCVRIMVGPADTGLEPGDGGMSAADGAMNMADGGGGPADAQVEPLDCATLCSQAIACLYDNDQCRQLTPGEERDVSGACATACEAGDIDRVALAGAACDDLTNAVLTATTDLATLCGIAAAGQPCRTGDDNNGVCIPSADCSTPSDPDKCLGDSVCCTGIECTGADDSAGECVGQAACNGQTIEADCPGMGTACCIAFSPAGSACTDGEQCSSGTCSDAMSSGRVTPNGFCEVECEDDMECGEGRSCISSGGQGVCFELCSEEAPCRDGWFCTAQRRPLDEEMSESVNVCLTDCRLGGCGREGICNLDTGICELMLEEVPECPYECGEGEVCTDDRCVRADNTCDSEYNCPLNYDCVEGTCQTDSFAECGALAPCAAGQTCVTPQAGNPFCLHTCNADAECPLHMACQALLGPGQPSICYYQFCEGPQLNGQCTLGASPNGTCRPLPARSNQPGICLQAGSAETGAECDSEADPRDAEESALACAPGHLCSGDRDDPMDPANMNAERGVCRSLCEVGRGGCGEGEACVQIGQPDNPDTVENELFNLGLCYESDCILFGDTCAEGETCQPLSFSANFGECRPAGVAGAGASCVDNDDCGPNSLCGNAGSGDVCIPFCNFQEQDCPWGQSCIPIGGGAVHVCL